MPCLVLKRLRVHVRPDGVLIANYRESPTPRASADWWQHVFQDATRRAGRARDDLEIEARAGPTLRQINTEPHWVWLYCKNYAHCRHGAATALTPFVIRWGPDAPADKLRRFARCARCGHRGADIIAPSWQDIQYGWAAFPTDR